MTITVDTRTGRAYTTDSSGRVTGSARTVNDKGQTVRITSGLANDIRGGGGLNGSRSSSSSTTKKTYSALSSWLGGNLGTSKDKSSNGSSNTTSNAASNTTPVTTPKPPEPEVLPKSRKWGDIVNTYFPKGYNEGGLVRGGGKAQRGVGKGNMR